jgi:hypothetical protein
MLAMDRSARAAVLTLLLLTNALNVVAQVLLLIAGFTGPDHGLLLPAAYAAGGLGPLASAGWIWILVRRLPDQAAVLLRPGFVFVGVSGLAGGVGQLLIRAQAVNTLHLMARIVAPGSPLLTQQQALVHAATIAGAAGIVSALGWLLWAIVAAPGQQPIPASQAAAPAPEPGPAG